MSRSEYVVFPSLLETLGLGIVEGVMVGCRAIISNDGGLREVVKPSLSFDPLLVSSISAALSDALQGHDLATSEVVIENRLHEFVDWLVH